jgi:hypothetical protein
VRWCVKSPDLCSIACYACISVKIHGEKTRQFTKYTWTYPGPCRRTGNDRATVLRDQDLLLLALYRITFPKATAAEINVLSKNKHHDIEGDSSIQCEYIPFYLLSIIMHTKHQPLSLCSLRLPTPFWCFFILSISMIYVIGRIPLNRVGHNRQMSICIGNSYLRI